MISIRKYLYCKDEDSQAELSSQGSDREVGGILPACLGAYRGALVAMGRASMDAGPAVGPSLADALAVIIETLSADPSAEVVAAADASVRSQVENWGRDTARHYLKKAGEVREMLLAVVGTAQSVGVRDQRCSQQLSEVTANLRSIASLEDISQIRMSIEKSALALKASIDRMTAEGKLVLDKLHAQVATFEAKLADAEQIASSDALTHLRSRLWMETQIERHIATENPFCIALFDIDCFKVVNDEFGHQAGDDVLRQFSAELKSACRSTDLVGRWGGDEFVVLLTCLRPQAEAQMERVRKWVCGSYTVTRNSGTFKLHVQSSIGLAQRAAGDTMKDLLDRADVEMYADKTSGRKSKGRFGS
jgi:diguanylate cyclase (GGDEF)-like protein